MEKIFRIWHWSKTNENDTYSLYHHSSVNVQKISQNQKNKENNNERKTIRY